MHIVCAEREKKNVTKPKNGTLSYRIIEVLLLQRALLKGFDALGIWFDWIVKSGLYLAEWSRVVGGEGLEIRGIHDVTQKLKGFCYHVLSLLLLQIHMTLLQCIK